MPFHLVDILHSTEAYPRLVHKPSLLALLVLAAPYSTPKVFTEKLELSMAPYIGFSSMTSMQTLTVAFLAVQSSL